VSVSSIGVRRVSLEREIVSSENQPHSLQYGAAPLQCGRFVCHFQSFFFTCVCVVIVLTQGFLTPAHIRSPHRWLWRADHAAGGPVTYDSNPCKNGLIVDGDDVTTYGLAVEHTEQDLTVWNGTISSMI
jgi:hypothetical protein